jgi:molybdopterin-guanine dinucleotide biosynthesis protein A
LKRSAIILAGGLSSRLGHDKGLLLLADKPLIQHVLDTVDDIVDEKLVVVSSEAQLQKYRRFTSENTRVLVDSIGNQAPLAGALSGFEKACGEYSLLLACDMPMVSRGILLILLDLCLSRSAAIPRWPNGYIEPLQAVYCTQLALEASRDALKVGELNLRAMVSRLRNVRYISTLVLEQLDPQLKTFLNINTPIDLRKAKLLLKKQNDASFEN